MNIETLRNEFRDSIRKKSSLVSSRILKKLIPKLQEDDLTKISLNILQIFELDLARDFRRENEEDLLVLQAFKDLIQEIHTKKVLSDDEVRIRNEAQVLLAYDESEPSDRRCQALMGLFMRRYRRRYGRNYTYRAIRSFYTSRDMTNMSQIEKTLGEKGSDYINWCFDVKEPGFPTGFYDTNILASSSMMNEFQHSTNLVRKDICSTKKSVELEYDFLQFIASLPENQKGRYSYIRSVKDLDWLLAIEQTSDVFEEPAIIKILKEARSRKLIPELKYLPETWTEERKREFNV